MHFFIFEPQVGDAGNGLLAALFVHKKIKRDDQYTQAGTV
jgi:hypothetical protein